jgi:Asp-tRNA(Asn)/Glu-tRNA(Gln) amidotransferase A subunit family amidase
VPEIVDKVQAWRAFSGENDSNTPPNGEFQNSLLRDFTVGIKDIIDVAGLPNRCGSAIYEHAAPALVDAACVALLREAGATIVGKTVTTELATFIPAATHNPVNAAHTPGGSSAGSAAAVAAVHVRIALGTQTAGSVLRPAAYCGVFGFKPSFDLVPRIGVKVQSESLDTVGVFARTVDDCASWLRAMGVPPLRAMGALPLNADENAPLRIGMVTDLAAHADADMRDALARARDALMRAGHHIMELTLPPPLRDLHQLQLTIQQYESSRAYTAERTQHRAHITPALRDALDAGMRIARHDYLKALRVAEAARIAADAMFDAHDCWLMPAAPGAAPLGRSSTGDPIFNRLASVLHTPAISVPAYRNAAGLPLGLQVIGRRDHDAALLGHAKQLHALLDQTATTGVTS